MTTKEGNVNFDGEGIDYDKGEREHGGYVDLDLYTKGKDGNMKKVDSKTRIDKLEKCIRNKDKRIKKIEGYFKLRNKLIITTVLSIVCGTPIAWMMYVFPKVMDNKYMLSVEENAIMLVGIITIIIVPIAIWLFSFSIIWEER